MLLIGIPPKVISDKGGKPTPPVQLEAMVEVKGGGVSLALIGITCEENTGRELEDMLVKSGGLRDSTFGAIVVEFDVIGMVLTGSSVLGVKVMGFSVVGGDVTGANGVRAEVTGVPVVGLEVTGAFVVGLTVTGAIVDGAELIGFFVVGDEVRGTFLLVGAQVGTTAGTAVVGILVVGGNDCKGRPCVPVKGAGAVVWK